VFVAAAGNDDLGEQLLDHYEQERIDVSYVQVFGCWLARNFTLPETQPKMAGTPLFS
jgi:sugar/nucleoside kinase (ribokinase family)